jgi:predicted DNA-binding ribbon-helix-helix protein
MAASKYPVKRVRRTKRKRSRRSVILKRTITIAGRRSGVSLEDAFWEAMYEIAAAKGKTRLGLIRQIDNKRNNSNLSSAIRLFVLAYYKGLCRYTALIGRSDAKAG